MGAAELWASGIALGAVFGVLFATQLRSTTLQWILAVLVCLLDLNSFWPLGLRLWHKNAIWMGTGALIADEQIFISFDGHWCWQSGRAADDASWKNHHQAVATSSGFGLLIAVPSVVSFFFVDIEAASRPHYSLGAWILWSLD